MKELSLSKSREVFPMFLRKVEEWKVYFCYGEIIGALQKQTQYWCSILFPFILLLGKRTLSNLTEKLKVAVNFRFEWICLSMPKNTHYSSAGLSLMGIKSCWNLFTPLKLLALGQ